MSTPWGVIELIRPHTPRASPLRAWSAADEFVLRHLVEEATAPAAAIGQLGRVLVLNDECGAIVVPLAAAKPTLWVDSALSRYAISENLRRNALSELAAAQVMHGDQVPQGTYDTVIVRVPKSTELLRHQLGAVAAVLAPDARVIGTGMARNVHNSTVQAFEELIGPTTTTRAWRKARLLLAAPHQPPHDGHLAATSPASTSSFVTNDGVVVGELPGTFSAGHVDIGSALLIEHLRSFVPPTGSVVADLGCGNGVLVASAASLWRDHGCTYIARDVSDLAAAATAHTWELNRLADHAALDVAAGDGFSGVVDRSVDVVISNPPFHQGHAVDNDLTDRLLADAARVLTSEGEALVVVQRHLRLHERMRKWFGSVETVSKHPTHVVLHAKQPRAR